MKITHTAIVPALAAAVLTTSAGATEFTAQFGWEDGTSSSLGEFPTGSVTYSNTTAGSETDYGPDGLGPVVVYNVTPNEGSRMLQVTELDTTAGNPNPILAWIDGLADGDTFSFSFDVYDPTDGRSPSILPSAVYTTGTFDGFAGFATPFQDFDDYPGGDWVNVQANNTPGAGIDPILTFEQGEFGDRTGVAVRAQLFAPSASQPINDGPGTYKFFIDNLEVTVNSSNPEASITLPDGTLVTAPSFVLGDMNGDGAVTNGDISPFVLALTDPAGYAASFPSLDPAVVGDFSGDGSFTNGDIAGFVDRLTGSSSAVAVPEPSSLALLGLGGLLVARRRRG